MTRVTGLGKPRSITTCQRGLERGWVACDGSAGAQALRLRPVAPAAPPSMPTVRRGAYSQFAAAAARKSGGQGKHRKSTPVVTVLALAAARVAIACQASQPECGPVQMMNFLLAFELERKGSSSGAPMQLPHPRPQLVQWLATPLLGSTKQCRLTPAIMLAAALCAQRGSAVLAQLNAVPTSVASVRAALNTHVPVLDDPPNAASS